MPTPFHPPLQPLIFSLPAARLAPDGRAAFQLHLSPPPDRSSIFFKRRRTPSDTGDAVSARPTPTTATTLEWQTRRAGALDSWKRAAVLPMAPVIGSLALNLAARRKEAGLTLELVASRTIRFWFLTIQPLGSTILRGIIDFRRFRLGGIRRILVPSIMASAHRYDLLERSRCFYKDR